MDNKTSMQSSGINVFTYVCLYVYKNRHAFISKTEVKSHPSCKKLWPRPEKGYDKKDVKSKRWPRLVQECC